MFKPLIINENITQYLISDNGEIKNIKVNKILQGTIRNGYKMVKLTVGGKKKDYLVHRLVALTFLDNPYNLPQVNHKDKNKLNNSVSNLEWISIKDNMIHRSQSIQDKPINKINKCEIILDDNWKQYKNSNYWISKEGQCYNSKTKTMLQPIKNGEYYRYCFSIEGKRTSHLIHKLVYSLFNQNYDNTKQINHIDGNKSNNNLDNLELITNSENMIHSYYILNNNINQIGQYDLNNNLIQIFNSMSEAARILGYSVGGISQACSGKIKTYKNFIWKKIV